MNRSFRLRGRTSENESDKAKKQSEHVVFKAVADKKRPTRGQLRYFFRLLNTRERWTAWIALLALVIATPLFAGRLYMHSTDVVPAQGGTYTEGLVGAPQYVNPLLAPLSDVDSDLSRLLFSGLFRETDRQELLPDLITNYTISEDQLTYTFYLRSDVEWHDGERLDADDVLFTIQVIQDPQYQSPLASSLTGVTAEKLDDFSFSLTLPEPFAPFLSTLTFGMLPEHLWFDVPAANFRLTELNIRPVGSGPYKFKELKKDKAGNIKTVTVERNNSYYAHTPYIDEFTFLFYPDIFAAVEALKANRVEGLAFFPQSETEEVIDANSRLALNSLRIPQYTAVFFNQKQSDVLRNDTVRKALAYSANRGDVINEALNGAAEPIYSAILPGYVGHNAEVEKYEFNVDEAIRLLEEDGWKYPETTEEASAEGEASEEGATTETVEEDTFVPREKDGQKLEFTIATVDLPEYSATLAVLQERWREIGAKVNVDTYSPQDIQSGVIKKRDYEALLFGQIVGSDPDPYAFWHSSQQTHPGLALSIFRDTEVDQLLEEARKTNDDNERRIKYLHFQNNIASEIPAIFLYNPQYNYAVHKKVQGIQTNQYIAVPSDRFAGVADWYINTDRNFK